MSRKEQLLENLKNITKKPEKKELPSTNMFYLDNIIRQLPKIYDKAKKHKDEDGDEYVWIDRLYSSLFEDRLIEKDGTRYTGKIYKKRRLIKSNILGVQNNFYSRCYSTADGRWFDNTGFPMEAPSDLEPEPQKTPAELEFEKEEKKRKEQRMLENLK